MLNDDKTEPVSSSQSPLVKIVLKPQHVIITEIQLSWGNIFDIMLKVSLLVIPLLIVLYYVLTVVAGILSSITG